MGSVCRICLTENNETSYYNLFKSDLYENNSNLATCVMECVPVHISLNDGLPDKLCSNCYDQLILVKNFRIKCLKSDSILRKRKYSKIVSQKSDTVLTNAWNNIKISRIQFNCPFCNSIFISKSNLRKHICLSHKMYKKYNNIPKSSIIEHSTKNEHENTVKLFKKEYFCDICNKTFKQHLRFVTHFKFHSSVVCSNKSQKQSQKYSIVKLKNRYNFTKSYELNKRKQYACKICKKIFNRRYLILNHLRVHSGERPFSCKICKSRFKFSSNLRNHMVNFHDIDKQFQCTVCLKRFKTNNELFDHQKLHQTVQNESNDTNFDSESEIFNNTNTKLFACKICKKIFERKYLLNAHTRVHSGERPFACKLCKKTFKYNSNLRHHMVDIHGLKKNIRKKSNSPNNVNQCAIKDEFPCEICSKIFKKKSLLNAHSRTHTGERPFICDICGKTFAFMGPLKIHLRIHAGDKRYKCEQCGKTCTTGSELSIHMKVHSDKLPYKCDICGKAFKWNSNCLKHKRKHSGIRAHQCNFCSKSFLELGTLKTHTRLHLGTLPYKCEICEKKFNISYNLKKHMQTHL